MILFLILLVILSAILISATLYLVLRGLRKVKKIHDKILLDQAATVMRIDQVRKEIEAATTPRNIR